MKIEHIAVAGITSALRGMRNPLQSWDKSVGDSDIILANKLVKAGASHRKFMRMINVHMDITANLKWWDEFDTYEHTVTNSTSQMHTLLKEKFSFNTFSNKLINPIAKVALYDIINVLNELRFQYFKASDSDKKLEIWRDILELIPQSYLYTRTTMINYEVFLAQYKQRHLHKMVEWRDYCAVLRDKLPHIHGFLKQLEK